MTPVGVAVVGCGFQGRIHAENVIASGSARLVACADEDIERATELASAAGARATADVEDVWDDPAVEAVIIATTTSSHHALAVAAAESGKHMLVEKPMALTVEECLDIERAAVTAGVLITVGYKFRFTAAAIAARAAVSEPRVLTAHTLYDPAPVGASSWVNDRSASGGRLVSSLVHSIDMLRFLSGDEVVRVSAEGTSVHGVEPGQPDTGVVTMVFAGGAIGSIVHGTAGASGLLSVWSFQSAARGVNATIHDHGRRATIHREGDEDDTVVVDSTSDPYRAGTAPLLDAFTTAIRGDGGPLPTARDGTISLLVARCVEQSIATRRPVVVPEV